MLQQQVVANLEAEETRDEQLAAGLHSFMPLMASCIMVDRWINTYQSPNKPKVYHGKGRLPWQWQKICIQALEDLHSSLWIQYDSLVLYFVFSISSDLPTGP